MKTTAFWCFFALLSLLGLSTAHSAWSWFLLYKSTAEPDASLSGPYAAALDSLDPRDNASIIQLAARAYASASLPAPREGAFDIVDFCFHELLLYYAVALGSDEALAAFPGSTVVREGYPGAGVQTAFGDVDLVAWRDASPGLERLPDYSPSFMRFGTPPFQGRKCPAASPIYLSEYSAFRRAAIQKLERDLALR